MPKEDISNKLTKLSQEKKKELQSKLKTKTSAPKKTSNEKKDHKEKSNKKIKEKKVKKENFASYNDDALEVVNTGTLDDDNMLLEFDALDVVEVVDQTTTAVNRGLVRHLKVQDEQKCFFSGGKIIFTDDQKIFGLCNYEIVYYDIIEKSIIKYFKHVNEEIANFTVSKDNKFIATFTRNSMLRVLSIEEKSIVGSMKMMGSYAMELEFDPSGKILVMGDASGTVTLFNVKGLKTLQQFKPHQGLNYLRLVVKKSDCSLKILSSGRDREVTCYDIKSGTIENNFVFEDETFNQVLSLDDGNLAVASSLDSNLYVWDLSDNKLLFKKTYAIDIDALNSFNFTDANTNKKHMMVLLGGTDGKLYVQDVTQNKKGYVFEEFVVLKDRTKPIQVIETIKAKGMIVIVDDDRDVTLLNFEDFDKENGPKFEIAEELMGYNDEVLDAKWIKCKENNMFDDWIALATNSNTLKFYNHSTKKTKLVNGHKKMILCLDVYDDMVLTGSRDTTIKLWKLEQSDSFNVRLLATFKGHAEGVQYLSVASKKGKFFVSTSTDKSLKQWEINEQITGTTRAVSVSQSNKTIVPHTKDINVVKISPNDKLVATGCADKTIKVFKASDLSEQFVLKGHKRGIWDLAFNKFEKLLASASGDCTIKIWNLEDGSNTDTLEGHLGSIVRLNWFSFGTQLISGSSDGVIKIWNVKKQTCLNTYEKHKGRMWALDINDKNGIKVISGDSDSLFVVWGDSTKEDNEKIFLEKQEKVMAMNSIDVLKNAKQFEQALMQAFDAGLVTGFYKVLREFFTYFDFRSEMIYIDYEDVSNFNEIAQNSFDYNGLDNTLQNVSEAVKQKMIESERILKNVIKYCIEADIHRLIKFIRDNNTTAKKSEVSQRLLKIIVKEIGINRVCEFNDMLKDQFDTSTAYTTRRHNEEEDEGLAKYIESIEAYTERHFDRQRNFAKKARYLDFVLAQSGMLFENK